MPSALPLSPPSCSSVHGNSHSSAWLVRAQDTHWAMSTSGQCHVPWGQKSSYGTSGYKVATRSDHACFPQEEPATPSLRSIFAICNCVVRHMLLYSLKQMIFPPSIPPSPCTPSPLQRSPMQATKLSFSCRAELMVRYIPIDLDPTFSNGGRHFHVKMKCTFSQRYPWVAGGAKAPKS